MSWASANTKRAGRGRCSRHWWTLPCPRCKQAREAEDTDRARSTLTLLSRFAVFMWMEAEANPWTRRELFTEAIEQGYQRK